MSEDADVGPEAEDLRRFALALASVSPRQGRAEQLLRVAIRVWCRVVDWRLDVIASEPLPTRDGLPGAGCVVAVAPHRAWVEPFLLAAAWPPQAARLVWLADGRTTTRSWWRRRLLPRLGIIPVAPSTGGPRAYARLARHASARGLAVAVAPESGPPSPPDRVRRISPGFAYLALAAGAPVVPVVIGGTHRIVRGSRFSLDICPPVEVGLAEHDPFTPAGRERAHDVVRRYEAVVASRLPQRTATADALAPEPERWRWLATLFR